MTAKSIPPTSDAKCVIVLDAALPLGLLANTAAVLSLTLGARLDIMGPDLCDADGNPHAGLTTIPVPILKGDAATVAGIRASVAGTEDVFVVDVSDAAQTTTTYDDYRDKLEARASDELAYLGIALYGERKAVTRLTGSLGLLR